MPKITPQNAKSTSKFLNIFTFSSDNSNADFSSFIIFCCFSQISFLLVNIRNKIVCNHFYFRLELFTSVTQRVLFTLSSFFTFFLSFDLDLKNKFMCVCLPLNDFVQGKIKTIQLCQRNFTCAEDNGNKIIKIIAKETRFRLFHSRAYFYWVL